MSKHVISIKERVQNLEQGIVGLMNVVNRIKMLIFDLQIIVSILIKKNILTQQEIEQERGIHAERIKIASEANKSKNTTDQTNHSGTTEGDSDCKGDRKESLPESESTGNIVSFK